VARKASVTGSSSGAPSAGGSSLGEDGDLDLLQDDRDDLAGPPGLEEERAAAGLTDGAGDKAVRGIEDEEASRHGRTLS